MEKIINCTPHNVTVYIGTIYDPDAGCSVGGSELVTIPPCGIVATAKSAVTPLPALSIQGANIPVCKRDFSRLTKLPEGGDLYIVSSVYAQAAAELGLDTSKLLCPYGTVKDLNGKQVGCTALVKN